jgi:hypothetical protein
MSKTSILIETETRQLLRRIGRKEQTYDQLINELIVTNKGKVSPESRIERPIVRRTIGTDQGEIP